MAWEPWTRRDNLIYALARTLSPVPEYVLRMKKNELDLALEAEPFHLGLRRRLKSLRQGVAKLLKCVEVGRPVRICHQEQRSRVSRVVF